MAVFLKVAGALRRCFGNKTFIAELGYPSGQMGEPFPWNNAQPGCSQTPDGQYRYLRDLVVRPVETGAVAGIRPWDRTIGSQPPAGSR
jgi:hypothetical protein